MVCMIGDKGYIKGSGDRVDQKKTRNRAGSADHRQVVPCETEKWFRGFSW